jgi:uncharacterized phiE125 gp8 family phage protein
MRPVLSEADELVTAPGQTIVPVVRAVRHIKPLETLDLERIDALLHTVDRHIEQALGASVLRATWRARFTPGCARVLQLREGPIVAVTEVRAFDDDAALEADGTVVPTTSYRVLAHRGPAEIRLRDAADWPVTLRDDAGVSVVYTAGAATLLDVPADIRHAALLLAAHLFEHPTPVVTGKTLAQLPYTVDALLAPYSQRRRCAA